LNNRNYLGKPVEINFFDNGLYITNSLKWNLISTKPHFK
jgi:hypothetical protein